uniref:Uncharacterized protein n=1 Tax=Anguilla anguilla TaxID=7936 RepID=A0A0E9SBZ6_ANGAN
MCLVYRVLNCALFAKRPCLGRIPESQNFG